MLVLEGLDHAKARGAKIYAEIGRHGTTSDGCDMVAPSAKARRRCMRITLETVKAPIDYINPHATATPIGDLRRSRRSARFSARTAADSATKSLTGHSLGAAGVQEAIYSLLMMNNGFICESANIQTPRSVFADMPIARERKDDVDARRRAVEFLRLRRHQRIGRFKRLDA